MNYKKEDVEFSFETSIDEHKIMSMDVEKRKRVIKAAMQEFCKGYTAASTDEIVKNAGISKGLLFHYFGSKKRLYLFLIKYAVELIKNEYLKVTFKSRDFLENLWEVAILSEKLSFKYPVTYKFIGKAAFSLNEVFPKGVPKELSLSNEDLLHQIFENSDRSLFRDDIDLEKACDIMIWTIKGYSDKLMSYGSDIENYKPHYEQIEKELKEYLQILRKALYR